MRVSVKAVSRIRALLCVSVLGLYGLGCTGPLDSFAADAGINYPDSSASDGGVFPDASAPPDGGTNGPLCEGYDEVICPDGTPCSTCPVGSQCYDGICTVGPPDCLDPNHPDYLGWPDDTDLEPNGLFELATTLPCADDGVVLDATEYYGRCPSRANTSHGLMSLLICPEGERDLYGIYLLDSEAVTIQVPHQYSAALSRDLDVRVWTWDPGNQQWRGDVAVGLSTDDDEQVSFTTDASGVNPQGWYYIEVAGKGQMDVNQYSIAFTLNP